MNSRIDFLKDKLAGLADEKMTFMEVCGTHTVSIFRTGLRSLLPRNINLLSGPGCPVCVTDQRDIDSMISVFENAPEKITIATYGDMMRVPGSISRRKSSLADLRGGGADVRVVTSAIQCIDIAEGVNNQVIFLGVGFETTAPATAVLIKEAAKRNVKNLSVYSVHKTIPRALRALASNMIEGSVNLDGFILPGNVSVLIGENPYKFIPDEYKKSCVIAGFEAEPILAAIAELARQTKLKTPEVVNFYKEAVNADGNPRAMKIVHEVFEECDSEWRGLGEIKNSGLGIREEFQDFDAVKRFSIAKGEAQVTGCECGKVLLGVITPPECKLFGSACTPTSPVGACMVSGEGTCGAWFRWNKDLPR
ncbi:MAG: hydrogenase formation protein HypD [Synergistaceae bacterium]|nr:hydrogenase formation protein HypD [Synergistaceae bacterium]